jgi:NitT/TauT family transport system substrate-binding protein
MKIWPMKRGHAAALFLSGTALWALPSAGRAEDNASLRIGTFAVENGILPYYARDGGFFTAAGIAADVQTLPGSSAIAAGIVSNSIDVGYGALDVLAAIHQKGIPIVVIAPGGEYRAPVTSRVAAIMVPANSTVKQARDLNGKIVAANSLHSLADAVPKLWVDQNGGDSSTLKFVEMPFAAMPAAFDAGRVDAALISEPFMSVAAKSARVLVYGYDCIAKDFLLGAYFTTPQWAKDHPDVIARFRTGMRQAAGWANANPAKSGELLAKYTKIDPTVIATMTRARFGEQLTPALMQPLIDVAAKFGGFSPFPARELIF